MKNLKWLSLLLVILISSCKEKTDDVEAPAANNDSKLEAVIDETYRPLLHFFTSTNCGGCGRFGIPVFSTVAKDMGDSILPLPTHFKYQDPFINNTSLAIEKAVVETYHSPQIWVNMEEITYSIIQYSLPVAVEKTKEKLREQMSKEPEAYVGLNYRLKENGRYEVAVSATKNANAPTKLRLFFEVYAMEDGLVASQAGADPYVATHYRVNRGGHYGEMGTELTAPTGTVQTEKFEFVPCVDCSAPDLYFYVVAWKDLGNGKFHYVNGKVVR